LVGVRLFVTRAPYTYDTRSSIQ